MRKGLSMIKSDFMSMMDVYESILDGLTCGVWVADENDVIYYINKGMEMIAGVTHQKLLGSSVLNDSEKSTIKYFVENYQAAKKTLQPVYYSEVPVVTPAGKQTYQSGWLIPIIKDEKFNGMICTVEDITNQKQTRKALSESETRYMELVENDNSIIMQMDLRGNITFFNRFAQRLFGFDKYEIIGRNVVGTIVPETERSARSVEYMLKNIVRFPGQYTNKEFQNIRKNGRCIWVAWTLKPLRDEDRQITEILCIGTDITKCKCSVEELKKCRIHLEKVIKKRTAALKKANEELKQEISERKWAEEILKSSEKKYRLVVENANEGISVHQDGFLKYVNPKAVKILGYPEEELISMPFIKFVHHDDRDMVLERCLKRLKGDNLPNIYSYRIINKDSTIKWVETNSVLITWMGRPATLTFFNNITERTKAAKRLLLLESAINQIKDSIVITTANTEQPASKIVFVNPAFTNMTGYTAEEVIGKPSIILQGPNAENIEWLKLENTQSQGKAFYVETVNYRKDGTKFFQEWLIAPIRNEEGRVTHFVSTLRDITDRKMADRMFKEYQEQLRTLASELSLTEERERRRIATQLHDHIGQTLAIIKIKLGTLQDSLPFSTGLNGSMDDIRTLIEQTIKYTKSLTFELSPPILYELGFEAVVEWLGEHIQKQYNIFFEFEDDGNPKPIDKEVSILMFQAVRELLMNIVKHAKAQKVKVSIQRDGGNMLIGVKDDGVGFDISKIDKTKSFGFFSINERLKYFGGTIEINTSPGYGTHIILAAPIRLNKPNKMKWDGHKSYFS